MKLRSIDCDENEQIEAATFTMSAEEIALVAKMVGDTSGIDRNKIMPNGGPVGSDVWDALSGLVNRFYEDGMDEMLRMLRNA